MFKSLVKQLPHPLLSRLYHHVHLREEATRAAEAAARAGLPLMESLDLQRLKTSDTMFVLGSAWSINDISEERRAGYRPARYLRHELSGLAHLFIPGLSFEIMAYRDHPVAYDAFLQLLERRYEGLTPTPQDRHRWCGRSVREMLFELPEGIKKTLCRSFSMCRSLLATKRNSGAELQVHAFHWRLRPCTNAPWLFKYGGSVIAMMTLAVRMGYGKRIAFCGVDLNKQDYFYQYRERYPECADWEFVSRKAVHLTTRRLPWLVPAQSRHIHLWRVDS